MPTRAQTLLRHVAQFDAAMRSAPVCDRESAAAVTSGLFPPPDRPTNRRARRADHESNRRAPSFRRRGRTRSDGVKRISPPTGPRQRAVRRRRAVDNAFGTRSTASSWTRRVLEIPVTSRDPAATLEMVQSRAARGHCCRRDDAGDHSPMRSPGGHHNSAFSAAACHEGGDQPMCGRSPRLHVDRVAHVVSIAGAANSLTGRRLCSCLRPALPFGTRSWPGNRSLRNEMAQKDDVAGYQAAWHADANRPRPSASADPPNGMYQTARIATPRSRAPVAGCITRWRAPVKSFGRRPALPHTCQWLAIDQEVSPGTPRCGTSDSSSSPRPRSAPARPSPPAPRGVGQRRGRSAPPLADQLADEPGSRCRSAPPPAGGEHRDEQRAPAHIGPYNAPQPAEARCGSGGGVDPRLEKGEPRAAGTCSRRRRAPRHLFEHAHQGRKRV